MLGPKELFILEVLLPAILMAHQRWVMNCTEYADIQKLYCGQERTHRRLPFAYRQTSVWGDSNPPTHLITIRLVNIAWLPSVGKISATISFSSLCDALLDPKYLCPSIAFTVVNRRIHKKISFPVMLRIGQGEIFKQVLRAKFVK